MKSKLVRDKILGKIKENGETPIFHIAGKDEYFSRLQDKLYEEADEVVGASDDTISEEIADVLEVLHAMMDYHGIDIKEIEKIRLAKKDKNGGFEDRIVLDDVI